MKFLPCLALPLLLASAALAVDTLPPIPQQPIATKGKLLFQDDFEGTSRPKEWHKVVDTFAFEDGTLKGTQTREKDVPEQDGKPAIMAHAAVHGLEIPTRDSVVEVKMKFDGATMMDVEFDDRKYTGSHYGHLCRAQLRLDGVTIIDERDGGMKNEVYELKKDPTKKAEIAKALAGRSVRYQAKLEAGKWYTVGVETAGDQMRVTIDGQPAAYLKSSGIAHETKSKIELGVAGKSGSFDEIKVWSAEPAK
jgi:hypothetical protein